LSNCAPLTISSNRTDQDQCFPKHIGYNPADIMSQIDHTQFTTAAEDSSKALTRVMILHPVACALAFIAFLFALGAGFCGAIFASMIAAVAWLVTLVVMVTDFVLFGIIKRHVNSDGSGSHAYYSVGMWTILAAMILLFIATFIVLFTCCSSRMHKNNRTSKETGYNGTTTTRRHFWQRRNRY
jgi:uncharacterized membrane protein